MNEDNIKKLNSYSNMSTSTIGWCQFIRRENYINSFMMNENFASWGPEDCELFYRLNLLGNRVDRIDDLIYHLEHARSNDSWFSNPNWQENVKLWEWIRRQDKETIVDYYQRQDYIKRRKINVSI
jgi:GT2 family glycosyltransferase